MTEYAARVSRSEGLLRIEQTRDDRGVTLVLHGELDLSSAGELELLLTEIQGRHPGRLLLDLSDVEFMDSTGIALIIRAERAAQGNGNQFHLRGGSPQVRRLLALTGILDRFTFED